MVTVHLSEGLDLPGIARVIIAANRVLVVTEAEWSSTETYLRTRHGVLRNGWRPVPADDPYARAACEQIRVQLLACSIHGIAVEHHMIAYANLTGSSETIHSPDEFADLVTSLEAEVEAPGADLVQAVCDVVVAAAPEAEQPAAYDPSGAILAGLDLSTRRHIA